MSKNGAFYSKQNPQTEVKIGVYRNYLRRYLYILLMQYGRCLIADLFCGPGKSGKEKGSPLVLVEEAKRVLKTEALLKKHVNPRIYVVFNDQKVEHIQNLCAELEIVERPKNLEIVEPSCRPFLDVLKDVLLPKLTNTAHIPKLFFLDPYGYSSVGIRAIAEIMDLPSTEILLFCPISFVYRFSNCEESLPESNEKTRELIENFTDGFGNYETIHNFGASIKKNLLRKTSATFIKRVLIDNAQQKYGLFFLTKHISGMFAINRVMWDAAPHDGYEIEVAKRNFIPLINVPTATISKFEEKLERELATNRTMTNVEIITFTAGEGFLMGHARSLLEKLSGKNRVEVVYTQRNRTRGFYIAEEHWKTELARITYLDDA